MLPLKSCLNFETVSEIREQGYSRIPVYDGDRNNILHILFAKDLMFIDPDDNMPLAMVCEFYNNEVNIVGFFTDNVPWISLPYKSVVCYKSPKLAQDKSKV
jgi:hypothetical protein